MHSLIKYPGAVGNGPFVVNFTLGFLSRSHVTAWVEGELDGLGNQIYRTITWLNDGLVNIGGAALSGTLVISRDTVVTAPVHNYQDGAVLGEKNLDESNLQVIMLLQEVSDGKNIVATIEAAKQVAIDATAADVVLTTAHAAATSIDAANTAANAASAAADRVAAANSAIAALASEQAVAATASSGGSVLAAPNAVAVRDDLGKLAGDILGNSETCSTAATLAQGALADAALPAASYTAADVLAKLKTVDGAASGIEAQSAATLTTARTIGGVSFSGATNINLPGVNTQGNQNTTGNAATVTTLTTAQVLAATAGAAYGVVGTYALLAHQTLDQTILAGSTHAGSSLRPTGVSTNNGTTNASGNVVMDAPINTGKAAVSGTWRAMFDFSVAGGYNYRAGIFLRIS